MRHALYIVGEPGAGKSTLVAALTEGWAGAAARQPIAHTVYAEPGVVELGARRDNGFSGTDALAMSAVVPASAWVQEPANPITWPGNLLLAEGDRLACDRFFEALLAGGWELVVVHLATPPDVAAARREARGSAQNESWLKGRITKVARLADRWANHELDGRLEPEFLAAVLTAMSPVAAALDGGTQ